MILANFSRKSLKFSLDLTFNYSKNDLLQKNNYFLSY